MSQKLKTEEEIKAFHACSNGHTLLMEGVAARLRTAEIDHIIIAQSVQDLEDIFASKGLELDLENVAETTLIMNKLFTEEALEKIQQQSEENLKNLH